MLPAILGLGGLTAKIIATAVIPRIVRAISYSLLTTRPAEPCSPSHVEGISTWDEPALAPQRSGVSGSLASSRKWGYAGLWHHGPSGLDLATYRAYDAANRRWISRDPLGEGVDYNLYRYCGNNPVSNIDPMGLDGYPPTRKPTPKKKKKIPSPSTWCPKKDPLTYKMDHRSMDDGGVEDTSATTATILILGRTRLPLPTGPDDVGPTDLEGLINSSSPGRKTKGRVRQYNRTGDFDTANTDFDSLSPEDVRDIPNGGRAGVLPDGSQVNVRRTSSGGPPTLEIQSGSRSYKFRYGP